MSQSPVGSMKGLLVVGKDSVRPEPLPPVAAEHAPGVPLVIPRPGRQHQLQPLTVRVVPELGDRLHKLAVMTGSRKQDIIAAALAEYLTKAGY